MSSFRIIETRKLKSDISEFVVEPITGPILAGEEFRCYDTHHPADYRILEADQKEKICILKCLGILGFEGQFEDAIIDTAHKNRGLGFHYSPKK